jgi:hypothetical protein
MCNHQLFVRTFSLERGVPVCLANLSCSISSKLGVPSSVKPGYAVLSEMAKGSSSVIPESLFGITCLTHVAIKALTALGDSDYTANGALPDCLPLVRTFESELIEEYERIKHTWTPEIEIFQHAQVLQIYSFALFGQTQADSSVTNAYTDQIHAKAVNTVLKLTSIARFNIQDSKYWPAFIKFSIMYSVIVNVPLANMEQHGSPQRLQLIQSLRDGIFLLKSFSMFEKDIWSRISSHISYILRKMEQVDQSKDSSAVTIAGLSTAKDRNFEQQKQLKMPVTSRIAANIIYHVVWTGKHAASSEWRTDQQDVEPVNAPDRSSTQDENLQQASKIFVYPGEFDPFLDSYAFTGWVNSGSLDISADWQSLMDNI